MTQMKFFRLIDTMSGLLDEEKCEVDDVIHRKYSNHDPTTAVYSAFYEKYRSGLGFEDFTELDLEEAFKFLSPAAYRFFLPRILICISNGKYAVDGNLSSLVLNTVHSCFMQDGSFSRGHAKEMFHQYVDGLSAVQKEFLALVFLQIESDPLLVELFREPIFELLLET